MLGYVNVLLAILVTTIGLSLYTVKDLVPSWNTREFGVLQGSWNKMLIWSSVVSVGVSLSVYHGTQDSFIALLIGTLTYFVSFAAQTDINLHLVPKEFSSLAIIVGALFGGVGLIFSETKTIMFSLFQSPLEIALTSLGLYTAVICLIFIALMFGAKGVGFADIKMFWATGFFVSWYAGYINMIALFMLVNILLFVHLIYLRLNKSRENIPVLPAFSAAVILGSILLLG